MLVMVVSLMMYLFSMVFMSAASEIRAVNVMSVAVRRKLMHTSFRLMVVE